MTNYDLCLAWSWKYDADFASMLASACQCQGLTLLQITPENVEHLLSAILNYELGFRSFFDRASDEDPRLLPLVDWLAGQDVYCINRFKMARRAWNKAAMHLLFTSAGLHTPHTIIIPPFDQQPDLDPLDLTSLGEVFSIKPAHGGGGVGVVTMATAWDQVLAARREFPGDRYLLQAYIIPAHLEGRLAWFRVLHCCGQTYPCWWDTNTHLYTPVEPAEMEFYRLRPLYEITASIARISRLELFSTEIAHTADGSFVTIDYINDPIDLRLQSNAFEGVPDFIVMAIADRIATMVALTKKINVLPETLAIPTGSS
ncbi:MAG: hypothetical protein EHM70_13785 [Chloroflexota bacterium]|nr:MAG: hypothetical protein EHM70_13785 [Chloroflexota bacterium]